MYESGNFQSEATTVLGDDSEFGDSEYGDSSLLLARPSSLPADSLLGFMEEDDNVDGDESITLDEQSGTRLSGAI
jgi:hypothetical protein